MDFKFVDANSIKSKFAAKSAKKEKTVEDVRASISKTLLKMIDGTKKNKKGQDVSTTGRVLRKGATANGWDFHVLYGTVRVFGGELTATTEQQAKDKLKAFAEEIRTGKGLSVQVNQAIKTAMETVRARGEKAAAVRKKNSKGK